MSEKRNINLTIADIPLNLNISAADEEKYRTGAFLFFSLCFAVAYDKNAATRTEV